MSNRIYLYPLVIRIWHFLNALAIVLLIFTGLSIQYSNPEYPFMRFDLAIIIHNYAGVFLVVNYLLFLGANIATGNRKHYKIIVKGFISRLFVQARFYSFGIFKGEKPPFPISQQNKFNPLQQLSYVAIMFVFLPLMIITGIALLYPELIPAKIFGIGGVLFTDLIHIVSGFFISIFLLIHLYFVTIGKTPLKNFKSIINGYHEENH
ncbi:MAG: cytochrome b/b6 domain-containing protein [Bacteroidales bacterium]|nr:cytochrome b/b6 domain-containing protein [Bacteroidales bacterium]